MKISTNPINIGEVLLQDLCVQCGTCVSVCPYSKIRMSFINSKFVPIILNNDCCENCGLCLSSCPGYEVDYEILNRFVFKNTQGSSYNKYLGNYISCYVGQGKNPSLLYKASAGGIVTSILETAISNNLIDGALVVGMSEELPLFPESYIARTKEELHSAAGSKYFPIPVNTTLREIIQREGNYAVVGLPCHINGIRKAELSIPKLKKKISLHIGLFCGYSIDFKATEFLLHKLGILKDNVRKISYRDGIWPGGFRVITKTGTEHFISKSEYNSYLNYFFTSRRCSLCTDQSNELSDISVGDAWSLGLKDGWSEVIVRTIAGEQFLKDAIKAKTIKVYKISPTKVTASQLNMLKFKKSSIIERMKLSKLFGLAIPKYRPSIIVKKQAFSLLRYLGAIFMYFVPPFAHTKMGYRVLLMLPLKCLKLYTKAIGFLIQR